VFSGGGSLPESDEMPARRAGEKGTCHTGLTRWKQPMPQPCRASIKINFSHNILYVKRLLAQHMPTTKNQKNPPFFLTNEEK
jgi:hypothetical protein